MHKVILAAQSDFFDALFTFEDKKEYKIGDVTQEILIIIIDSFYGMPTVFDKSPFEVIIVSEIDTVQEVIAQVHYFQAPVLLRKTIKSLMEIFEATTQWTYSTWLYDVISDTLDFSRNFQVHKRIGKWD